MDTREDPGSATGTPRASRIAGPEDVRGLRSELWMGGAEASAGEPVTPEMLADAWVLDCAGRMPESHRISASRWVEQVFPDIGFVPSESMTLVDRAQNWAIELLDPNRPAPARVFIMCQFGMNRSGLATGLLLRALGMSTDEAARLIKSRRPGALGNTRLRWYLGQVEFPER